MEYVRTWNVLPELTDVLLQLSSTPCDIPKDETPIIEQFVILLYDRTNTLRKLDNSFLLKELT